MAFEAKQLHVLTMISNPVRFTSRYRLYNEFKQRMLAEGVTLWTCELQMGDRPFAVTSADDPQALQLRTDWELWHKENALNLLIQRLPHDWQYCATIDADVHFASYPGTPGTQVENSWALECLQLLQRYQVVQMWRDALDLGPEGEIVQRHESYMYRYASGLPVHAMAKYGQFGHPGYAWAYNRASLNEMSSGMSGPLLDTAVLGSADHHMCLALVGRAAHSIPKDINQAYYDEVIRWEQRADRYISRDVGYMPGTLIHYWHGAKGNRKYVERWNILKTNDFTPHLDLKRDWQGLYALTSRNLKLRDDIRAYFNQRNEDSVDAP